MASIGKVRGNLIAESNDNIFRFGGLTTYQSIYELFCRMRMKFWKNSQKCLPVRGGDSNM
jgi:hypothetical protein